MCALKKLVCFLLRLAWEACISVFITTVGKCFVKYVSLHQNFNFMANKLVTDFYFLYCEIELIYYICE